VTQSADPVVSQPLVSQPVVFQRLAGTFHGLATVGLAGSGAWFEALAADGPRIVRLGLTGGPNLLAETPEVVWPTAAGPYRLWGGHRLWLAPEDAGRNAAPDSGGLVVDVLPDGLRLTGAPDPGSACVRAIEVRLDPQRPVLRLRHEVANLGRKPVELAPWAITQLPPGGTALIPQPASTPGHATRPDRLVVLWPYASWDDPRLVVRDGLLAVHGTAGPDVKVGCAVAEGWTAWVRDGVAIVRRWIPVAGVAYPDFGCSAEVFATQRYTELEVLGPLTVLEPGDRTALDETWELREVPSDDLGHLRDTLAQPL
jgi:hypothetical protein